MVIACMHSVLSRSLVLGGGGGGGEQSAAILVSRPNYSYMLKYFLGIIVWPRDYSIAI